MDLLALLIMVVMFPRKDHLKSTNPIEKINIKMYKSQGSLENYNFYSL